MYIGNREEPKMRTISDEYRFLCEQMHAQAPWGTKGYRYIEDFLPFFREQRCHTILDYGCGHETIKEHLERIDPDIQVNGYDPAIPALADPPDPAHFVVCTDVMEHVEEEFVDQTFAHIQSLAMRGAYFCIALTPAKRHLPNGQNAHITLKPVAWWVERIHKQDWYVHQLNPGKKSLKVYIKAYKDLLRKSKQ